MGSKEHRSCVYSPPKEASCREGKHGGNPGTPGQIKKEKSRKKNNRHVSPHHHSVIWEGYWRTAILQTAKA